MGDNNLQSEISSTDFDRSTYSDKTAISKYLKKKQDVFILLKDQLIVTHAIRSTNDDCMNETEEIQKKQTQDQRFCLDCQSLPSSENTTTINIVDEKAENNWRDNLATIKLKLDYILSNEILPDIAFIVGPEKTKVFCHKLILMISSSVLQQKLGEMNELSLRNSVLRNVPQKISDHLTEIMLPNISKDALKSLLKYIYTDKFDVSLDNALEVFSLAKIFGIQGLVERCCSILKCNISNQNVLAIYQTAMEMGENELHCAALAYIFKHSETIVNFPEFLTLSEESLCSLLEKDEFVIDELVLFNAVHRWGVERCKQEGLTSVDLYTILKKPLQFVRFPLLTPEQLTLHIADKNVLDDSQLLSLYKYLSLKGTKQRNSFLPLNFTTHKRGNQSRAKTYVVNRIENIDEGPWNCSENTIWKVDFMVNRLIKLNGYGFLGSYEVSNTLIYEVEIQLIAPDMKPIVGKEIVYAKKPKESFHVKFLEPVPLIANIWYTAAFRFIQSPSTLKGVNPTKSVSVHCGDVGRVSFLFRECSEDAALNQLSKILFSL